MRIVLMGGLATQLIVAASILAVSGDPPPRRLFVSATLVVAAALAVAAHRRLAHVLRRRPRLLLGVAALYGVLTAWDGLYGPTPFGSTGFPILCIAAVAGSSRLILEVAAVLGGARIVEGAAWGARAWPGRSEAVVGDVLLYGAVAAVLIVVVGAFRASVGSVHADLTSMRAATGAELAPVAAAPPALPRADAAALVRRLTPAERRVVQRLGEGLLAKQIALEAGVSVATVRAQIKAAKRKTGARTLGDLAGLFVAAPGEEDGDR
jgi:DNA-binding CsgD family transcriptional regulator